MPRDRIKDMINIAERPIDIADRAVPGHWEGDLITGAANATAIGTLVERTTGFVMLLHLPERPRCRSPSQEAIHPRRRRPARADCVETLSWDQGIEMANHAKIAEATGLDIHFCDPHSPWQRPQQREHQRPATPVLPQGHRPVLPRTRNPRYASSIELNNRPRKRLGWRTPAEAFDKLLSEHNNQHGVADAG